jgi:thiol-disulfide isomerase/thioredoxin
MKRMAMAALAVACLTVTGCDQIDPSRGDVGEPAPEYMALTLDGDSTRLSDLKGQVVLLNVWATWCAPCREEIPALQALYESHVDDGFQVVGVTVDGRNEVANIRRFAEEFRMTYPIWHDPEDRFGVTFRTIGVPVTLLVDRGGTVRWRHMGPVVLDDEVLNAALDAALAEQAS